MDDTQISLAIGWPLAAVTVVSTLMASVVEESLKLYHRAELFELLAEKRHARFEQLLKREEDYFIAARMMRLAALVVFLGACLLLLAAYESPFEFSPTHLVTATVCALSAAVVLGGLVPAVWARNWAEPTLKRLLPTFDVVSMPLRPLVTLINVLERGVAKVAGEDPTESPAEEFEDDIADQLDEAARDGVIGEGERQMIDSIIEFSRDTVLEAMIPRTAMVSVDVAETVDRAVQLAHDHGHSRLPVTEGGRDRVIGIFNLKDAMAHWHGRNGHVPTLRELMRPAVFVPESKKLPALLAEFKTNKSHLAIVLDEFGGTSGMVTLEDVLEEIVGEIADEHDHGEPDPPPLQPELVDGDGMVIDARMKVDDLNAALDSELPESQDYTSIGGLISARIGRIPGSGEEIEIGELVFRVVEANDRAVKRLSVRRAPEPEPEASGE